MNSRKILSNMKKVSWQGLTHIFLISIVGLFISFILWGNEYLRSTYPTIEWWFLPLGVSTVTVFLGSIIWSRKKEIDVLKYEFIAVVTHKFRTPLTRIKWSLELLKDKQANPQAELAVTDIAYASESLVELTDMLVDLARSSQVQYAYDLERVDLIQKVRSVFSSFSQRFIDKKINVTISCPFQEIPITADGRRLTFAIQILIENAIAYTPEGGNVIVTVGKGSKMGFVSIKDSGIGISKEDMKMILTQFWRSGNAKKMDTEGMGIGLYMANQIAQRHNGSLGITSGGEGNGSTFTLNLPLA